MKEQLIHLLKTIEEFIPPPANCHHCLTFARYGEEEKLALQVNKGGVFHCIFLDEDELQSTPRETAIAIALLLNSDMVDPQLGVGPGQYTS